MVRITWTKHVGNDEDLRKIESKTTLITAIRNRHLTVLVLVKRKEGM